MLTDKDRHIIASLEKPGAGIPFVEKTINRLYVKPFLMKRASWEDCGRNFTKLHTQVSKELADLSVEKLTQRVLVPKQRALEDSSRYWSMAMTARHLTIVGTGIKGIISALAEGKKIETTVDIAKVKPEEEKNEAASIAEFELFAQDLVKDISPLASKINLNLTHHHPWLGAMNAKDWFWLESAHLFIHLQQLRRIKTGLI